MVCSYSPPCNYINPNNVAYSLGSSLAATLKVPNHWNWYTCSNTNPSWVNGGANLDSYTRWLLDQWALHLHYYSTAYSGASYLDWVGHLGAYTNPKGNCSYHRQGKAIDIAWIGWNNMNSRPCNGLAEASTQVSHRRALGVEASLRKYFGYVLNRKITDHHNHYHVDSGCPTAFHVKYYSQHRAYKSTAYYVQDCINRFHPSVGVLNDGIWGPSTEAGFTALLNQFGMSWANPRVYVAHWNVFNDKVMMHGFANQWGGVY